VRRTFLRCLEARLRRLIKAMIIMPLIDMLLVTLETAVGRSAIRIGLAATLGCAIPRSTTAATTATTTATATAGTFAVARLFPA
jgi:hypothetical protein